MGAYWLSTAVFIISIVSSPLVKAQEVTAPIKQHNSLKVALVVYGAVSGADLATTMYALGAERGREGNLLYAPFTNRPWATGAIKMGTAAGVALMLTRLVPEHPKTVKVATVFISAAVAGITIHNARIVRDVQ